MVDEIELYVTASDYALPPGTHIGIVPLNAQGPAPEASIRTLLPSLFPRTRQPVPITTTPPTLPTTMPDPEVGLHYLTSVGADGRGVVFVDGVKIGVQLAPLQGPPASDVDVFRVDVDAAHATKLVWDPTWTSDAIE